MGKVKYTTEQIKAIETTGNVIVSAGAGSGKTQVLTERVKYFVKKGYKLDEFLILTFTNLAAGEMKDRIRKALTKEGLDAANYVDTADICTFDSYALSIVKKYHFMLNVSPNISIVDSNIISVRKRTIIEDIFEELYKENNQEFLNMIDRFCFKDDIELKELTLKLYEKSLLDLDTDKYLDNYITNFYSDEIINEMISKTVEIIKEERKKIIDLNELATTRPTSKKDPTPFNELILSTLKPFLEANTYDELLNTLPDKLGLRSPSIDDNDEKKANQTYLKTINDLIKKIKSFPHSSIEFFDTIKSNIPYAKVLLSIVKELDKRIKKYKEKYQVFEFNDIAKLALNLVKTNTEVRELIKNKLKMIMIDEYQDTSSLQEAFINQIENNNVYMVGDVKQSIYRFRNARCDIFINKYEKYKNHDGGTAIDLNKNFRSRKEVLSDINYIFKNLMTKEYGGADYRLDHIIEYGNQTFIGDNKTNVNNHSTFLYHNTQKPNDIPIEEANIIARDIIDKINNHYQVLDKDTNTLRDCKFSDFCILMDRGNTFDTYAKEFSKYHLPLYVENDENISECDIVLILINILKLIRAINNSDYKSKEFKKAFLSVARSFLFNYSDNDLYNIANNDSYRLDPIMKAIKDVLYEYSTYPLSKQFEKIIFKLDIYNKLIYSGDVTKNEQYLDMFLNMFNDMSKLDYSLEDFIIYMENIDTYKLKITLSSKGSNLDSIKIMNIHKSKGLEFSIIYFAGLYKAFNQEEYKNDFAVSNKYGLILAPLNKDDTNIIKTLNTMYEYKEDVSERIRLFYVALTRTKEKMIFVCNNLTNAPEKIDIEKLKDNFRYDYDIPKYHIRDTARAIVKGYFDGNINKQAYLDLLNEYSIPRPVRYEYLLSPTFEIREDDIENEFIDLDNTINELLTVYNNDKKEVIIDIYNKVLKEELDDFLLTYALDIFNLELTSIDDMLDEEENSDLTLTKQMIINKTPINKDNLVTINQDNFTNKVEERNLRIKHEEYLFNLFDKYINKEITKDDLSFLINILGYNCDKNYLDYLNNDNNIDPFDMMRNLITNKLYSNSFEKDQLEFENIITNLNPFDYLKVSYIINGLYPKHHTLRNVLSFVYTNKTYPFDIKLYALLISKFGYEITDITKEYLIKLHNGTITEDEINEYFDLEFTLKFIPLKNIKECDESTTSDTFRSLLIDNLNNVITKEEFNIILGMFNYELDIDYLKINQEDLKLLDPKYVMDIVSIKDVPVTNLDKSKSFNNFLDPFTNSPIFEKRIIDTTFIRPTLNKKRDNINYEKLDIRSVNVDSEEIEIFRASKKLDLTASKSNMDFGTHLHFILETTDFLNPDYSTLSLKEQKIVEDFLSSKLMKDRFNAKIFKEYEFFDEKNQTNGIIDLMMVYPDHIDIIDYKTKNIEDESYQKQLKVYEDFVKNKFNLPTKTYLYSLLTGDIK